MKRKQVLLLPLLFFVLNLTAQETNTNTLEGQFVDVIDKSNNYQEYKVIKKSKLNRLRKNILDSVTALETIIDETKAEVLQQENQIATLTNNLKTTQGDLATSKEKENGIEFFGILTNKSTYNTIMWSIIGILLLGLSFFIYKFRNSNSITRAARQKLAETETEFESHRQRTLEQQQQLRRKLQDEINKNKKPQ